MIINLASQTDLSGFYVVYNGSTYLEKEGTYGISHLVEHLACMNHRHMQLDMDRDGIYSNAYTSNDHIVFYITGINKYVDKHKDRYLDSLLGELVPNEQDFDKERKVVVEEYLDMFNNQMYGHFLNIYRYLYKYYGPIGKKENLISLTYDDCLTYYNSFIRNPSMIVNISNTGDFNRDVDFKNYETGIKYTRGPYISEKLEKINKENKVTVVDISKDLYNNIPETKFICNMLSDGLESPLMDEIRTKKGLTYGVSCSVVDVDKNYFIEIAGSTTKADEFKDTVAYVLRNKDKFMTKERFDVVMNGLLIERQRRDILQYKSIGDLLVGDEVGLMKNLENLTYDKIMSVYDEHFNIDDFYRTTDLNIELNP